MSVTASISKVYILTAYSSQRYLTIKAMTPAERKKVNPKVVFFAGKAAPGCECLLQLAISILPMLIRIFTRLYREAGAHRVDYLACADH